MNSPTELESFLYDAFMAAEEPGDEEFFAARAAENKGPLLELGCGSGRVLIALAQAGFDVEGLDLSKEMLARARQRAELSGLQVPFHLAPMESFLPARKYGTIYSPGFSFQLLTKPEVAFNALVQWRDWLLPKGELLLTLYWPWEVDEGVDSTNWEEYNEISGEDLTPWLLGSSWQKQAKRAVCSSRAVLDYGARTLCRLQRYQLLGEGENEGENLLAEAESSLEQLWWRPEQIEELCLRAGWSEVELFSGFTSYPLEEGDGVWTVSCRA